MGLDTATRRPLTNRTYDHRWTLLQRSVAVGEVIVFAGIMLLVRGRFIPPLAIAAGLFGVGGLVSLWRARAGAIAIGGVAALWFGLNLAFAAQVVPDLLAPQVTEIFVPTFAMNVLAAAGTVGLIGASVRLRGRLASYTLWTAVTAISAGTVVSIVAGLLA